MAVAQKTEIELVDGTPVKRMFWSIISDYDLTTGLRELIDNCIDLWTLRKSQPSLSIDVTLDYERQMITIVDNAGGVEHQELRLLITPGGSRNDPNAAVIGIFGVGGKRASIALGEHVEIRTRYKKQQTFQLDITKGWLETEEWDMPVYAIPEIAPSTTIVEISHLRRPFYRHDVYEITASLGETYAWFLERGCGMTVNDKAVVAKTFDKWAYPAGYPPQGVDLSPVFDGEPVKIRVTAGLITDRDPEAENYGVYVYCNHRLIVKELRTRDVGYFVTAEAGVPHPDASLCRAIVDFQGPAKSMPWNSSKSGINSAHPVFQQVRPLLIKFVSYFSSLSRRTKNEWDEKVTRYTRGSVEPIEVVDIADAKRLNLPALPRVNKQRAEQVKTLNKKLIKDSPWTLGLVEAMVAVDVIFRQRLETRNRIALILLDSNLEIALKEFIVHRPDLYPPTQYSDLKIAQIFKNRPEVIKEVTQKVNIPPILISKVNHYYGLRNKLIHERATTLITNTDVENYRSTVREILAILFKMHLTK